LKKVQENQELNAVGGTPVAIRQLRYHNDPILRKKSKEVPEIDVKIRQILDDMMDTLHHTDNGAALAANQVGVLKRLVVIDYNGYYLKLVNPKIVEYSGEQECIEGCLSFPNRFVKTIRPQKVTIQALNENGEELLITEENEMAKCFCHELEHLDGEVFLDKAIEEVKF
jgi:peptide deformylase